MILAVSILVVLGIAAGPALAKLESRALRQGLGWLILAALILAVHLVMLEAPAFFRMVGICCVLLGGMKGLVYAEWAGGEKLPLSRYVVFSYLWFGMDPGTFRRRCPGLSWKGDVVVGLLLVVFGLLGAWIVWLMGWRQILVMFLPMSLGFHFGVLRVLKGLLRMAGFPVRTLFPNPLKTTGIADFWSRRWNVGYSQMMQRLVGRPVQRCFGANAGALAVFVSSGVLHELAITLPVRSGFGLPTLYFTLHGVLMLLEKRWGRTVGKVPALLFVMLPIGWLFSPAFQREVIEVCLEVFGYFSAWM